MNSTELKIDTGNEVVNNVAKMRMINNLDYVNKNMRIYNGSYYSSVQVVPYEKKLLGSATNGM